VSAWLANLHEDEVPQFENVGVVLVDKGGGVSEKKMN
jgi:hypothetical protein